MPNFDLLQVSFCQGQLQRVLDILGSHRFGQLPGQDIPGVIIKHRCEIVPMPTLHLHMREIGLPEFVHPSGGFFILVFS